MLYTVHNFPPPPAPLEERSTYADTGLYEPERLRDSSPLLVRYESAEQHVVSKLLLGSEDCARCEVARPYFRRGEEVGSSGPD